MVRFIYLLFLCFAPSFLLAQAPPIQWQKCLGGSQSDSPKSIQQTSDGGYIVIGYAESSDGDVIGQHGGGDMWVVKLSNTGSTQWQKCLGGSGFDWGYSIQQTVDGGYITVGFTTSSNGDVSGLKGGADAWVVKLTSTGAIDWQKCLGGSQYEYAYAVRQTTDGGYIVTGEVYSMDGDVSGHHGTGGNDGWVVKLTSTGSIQWQKCLGGTRSDYINAIQQTTDGGYIVAGGTESNNDDVSGQHGSEDFWVVKLTSTGSIQWQACLGGSGADTANDVHQTTDGGYIVVGATRSSDGNVSGQHGSGNSADNWVIKLTASGNLQWQKCLGGTGDERATSIQQTADGGYIVGSYTTTPNNGDVSGKIGAGDVWVVKLTDSGTIQWQKCMGGFGDDSASSIQQTTSQGYIVASYTYSINDGDVSGFHGGSGVSDMWIVKLSAGQLCASTQSGDWSNSTTWSCGHEPTLADVVTLNTSHTVTISTAIAHAQKLINNGGTLKYSPLTTKLFLQGATD